MAKKKSVDVVANEQVSLQAPWVLHYKKIYNVLTRDPEIEVTELTNNDDESEYSFNIESANCNKIVALSKILKQDLVFGNVSLKINFLVKNDASDGNASIDDFLTAFEDNQLFYGTEESQFYKYLVFKRDIVSYMSDDLHDYCLNSHMIAADMVKDIVNEPEGISICTEAPAVD